MSSTELNSCTEEWDTLEKEFDDLEEAHRQYSKKVAEVKSMQKKCLDGIAHQRYRLKAILETSDKLRLTGEDKEKAEELKKKMSIRKIQFRDMEEILPHKNGLYLTIILGSVNVSLLSKNDKYVYKEDYERFKLVVTMISLMLAIFLLFADYRFFDAVFEFLLVWYYCTLTIREHILKVNGSRIRGWWISHHFVSTVISGIILIWPTSVTYSYFRPQFVVFSLYLSIVQIVQYYYQKGILYRLRSLGERHTMDITVEGFQSWMWRGLTFVLPFLYIGYAFQLYNAYVLYHLAFHEECREWQVPVLAVMFFVIFVGNTWTTSGVIRQKVQTEYKKKLLLRISQKKYSKIHQT